MHEEREISLAAFDRYVAERGIPVEEYRAAFARWIAETTGGPVPRFERVEREPPADEIVIEGDDLESRFAFVFGGDF